MFFKCTNPNVNAEVRKRKFKWTRLPALLQPREYTGSGTSTAWPALPPHNTFAKLCDERTGSGRKLHHRDQPVGAVLFIYKSL
jgi:hypothetical protein